MKPILLILVFLVAVLVLPSKVNAANFYINNVSSVVPENFEHVDTINDAGSIAGSLELSKNCFIYKNLSVQLFALSGGFNSPRCLVTDINENNEVVGVMRNYHNNGADQAFIWENGTPTDFLGLPVGYSSEARSINNNGQIAGRFGIPTSGTGFEPHGFVWKDGQMTQLPCQAIALDNNDFNEVLAYHESDCAGSRGGMIWKDGNITNLDFTPIAFNNTGKIIGRDRSTNESFIFENGIRTPLPNNFTATEINDVGVIVGRDQLLNQAAIFKDGEVINIGSILDGNSLAQNINNLNQIVGSRTDQSSSQSLIWHLQPNSLNENTINNYWGLESPSPDILDDYFAASWEGEFDFDEAPYRFISTSDNSTKIFLDNELVTSKTLRGPGQGIKNISAGSHSVRFEYIHNIGSANSRFAFWKADTCYDLNADNIISSLDLQILSTHYGQNGFSPWDLNFDSIVNSLDLGMVAKKFGLYCPY